MIEIIDEMKQKNKQVLLHLSLIHGIGPAAVLKILRYLYHQAFPDLLHIGWMEIIEHQEVLLLEKLYDYSLSDFIRQVGLSEKLAQQLAQGLANMDMLQAELDLAACNDVTILTMLDHEYPEILKQIHTPPLVLYYQGAPFHESAKRMGIVGSRKATGYAQHIIQGIVPGLVTQGWQIVSGGAEGADTMAHEAALEVGGTTIAILGSGLLQPYPESNRDLFRRMVQSSSTVVSSFSLNAQPEKGNFPARNRIVSGLSLGCVIVQAAARSGALITAHCALEQGRQVFAVPGLIHDELSAGCHALIKQGAKLVNNVNDILEEFSEHYPQPGIFPAQKTDLSQIDDSRFQQSLGLQKTRPVEREQDPLLASLDDATTLDELIEKTGFDIAVLQDRLFTLQLEGKVRQTFTGMWERIEGQ